MASESSFDIVNKVDRQEVDNALNQAAKEVSQRFDFKNVDAGIKWSGESIDIQANTEERANAVLDVFKDKLVKRQISLKGLEAGDPKLSGKIYKMIRDEGPKGVKAQVQGDELRVSSKSRDDLQAVQRLVREQDYDFAVQFVNYR